MTKISLKNTVKKSGQNGTKFFADEKGFCIDIRLVSLDATLRATYQAVSKLLLKWWLFYSYHMVDIKIWTIFLIGHIIWSSI